MAFEIFPNVYQADRGTAPAPGDLPANGQPRMVWYIAAPNGGGGVAYIRADDPRAASMATVPGARRIQIDEAQNGNINGYNDTTPGAWDLVKSQGTPASQGVPTAAPAEQAPQQAAPPVTPAQTQPTVAPSPPTAPAPGATNPGPSNSPSLGTPGSPAGTGGSQSAQQGDRAGLYNGNQLATGRWMRATPWGANAGDQLGVDFVREDSDRGRALLAQPNYKPQFVNSSYRTVDGIQVPEELALSEAFQAAVAANGTNIIGYDTPPGTDENGKPIPTYAIKFRLPNGAEKTYKFATGGTRVDASGQSHPYTRIAGSPEVDVSGVTTPEKDALTKAQTDYQVASAAAQRAETQLRAGQITKQDYDNAVAAMETAEKQRNYLLYGTSATEKDLLDQRHTAATTALTQANVGLVGAQTAAAQQGTVNQTYNNVLQYYRDIYQDEAKALEATQRYFEQRAQTDTANNNTALGAARAAVDANTAANTQRVSLANNRLNASNTGFSDDFRQAADLNQYLKPGSTLGAQGFMAMQALRYANAKKYGAFDVNDSDLRYDESKLPNGIRAFMNPTNPSFATFPTLDEMLAAKDRVYASNNQGRERPKPPDHTQVQQPPTPPTVTPTPSPGYKPGAPNPGASVTPAPRAGQTPPPPPPQNISPDDVITLVKNDDANTVIRIRRSDYDKARAQGGYPDKGEGSWRVDNAQNGVGWEPDPNKAGQVRPISQGQPPAGTGATSPAGLQPGESMDDIVTVEYPSRNGQPDQYIRLPRKQYLERVQAVREGSAPDTPEYQPYDEQKNPSGYRVVDAGPSSQYVWDPTEQTYKPIQGPAQPQSLLPPSPTSSTSAVAQRQTPSVPDRPYPLIQPYQPDPSLTGPLASLAPSQQLLTDSYEEEQRKKRQNLLPQSPEAVYSLFDGAYPSYPTFGL